MSPDVNDPGFRAIHFDELVTSYKEQVKGLYEGGSDILFIETVFDTLNANEEQMEYQTLYASAKNGWVAGSIEDTIKMAQGKDKNKDNRMICISYISHISIF